MEKICIKCKLPKSNFYKHSGMKDGYLNKCIDCCKEEAKENFDTKMLDESFRVKERERYKNRGNNKEKQQKFRQKYPEKRRAYNAMRYFLRPRNINSDLVYHHWSYNDEHFKDIIFLTEAKHTTIHKFITYDQNEKKYRTKEGILLSTKLEHENYINKF